jgi:opacity protein-like surface antigen
MKKLMTIALMAVAALSANAQNIQLHYDFGRNIYSDEEADRQKVTATVEQFKADDWGSWYYFFDVDLTNKATRSIYTEISREINLSKNLPLAAHVEYDGGLWHAPAIGNGSYQQAGLAGIAYNGHNADFSKTWSVQALYKQFLKSYEGTHSYASFQLTGVWGLNFLDNKMTFSGFIDFWRGEKANNHGCLVILTEPQLWYNVNKHFSIGTEVEISDNFIVNYYNDKTFFVNPTLGVKWNL